MHRCNLNNILYGIITRFIQPGLRELKTYILRKVLFGPKNENETVQNICVSRWFQFPIGKTGPLTPTSPDNCPIMYITLGLLFAVEVINKGCGWVNIDFGWTNAWNLNHLLRVKKSNRTEMKQLPRGLLIVPPCLWVGWLKVINQMEPVTGENE